MTTFAERAHSYMPDSRPGSHNHGDLYTDSEVALVNESFPEGDDLDGGQQPFPLYESLQDLQTWWRAQKSRDSMDYPGHLEQVRRTRQSLMQLDLLAGTAEPDLDVSLTDSSKDLSREHNRNGPTIRKPEKNEVCPVKQETLPEAREKCQEPDTHHVNIEEASNLSSELNFLPPSEVERHPDKTEQCLQKLIDDSVFNMTWATKVLYKYRSIEHTKQELKDLGATGRGASPDNRFRGITAISQPVLPSQAFMRRFEDSSSFSAPYLPSPRARMNSCVSESPILTDCDSIDERGGDDELEESLSTRMGYPSKTAVIPGDSCRSGGRNVSNYNVGQLQMDSVTLFQQSPNLVSLQSSSPLNRRGLEERLPETFGDECCWLGKPGWEKGGGETGMFAEDEGFGIEELADGAREDCRSKHCSYFPGTCYTFVDELNDVRGWQHKNRKKWKITVVVIYNFKIKIKIIYFVQFKGNIPRLSQRLTEYQTFLTKI